MHSPERFLGERWAAELRARYAEPHRRYHTFAHVEAVLAHLEGASDAAIAAAYFHDVIYDTRSNDNEVRSAELAATALAGRPYVSETRAIILGTKAHDARGLTNDGLRMLDADLAILGADEAAYDEYARQIREEYEWVPEVAFRAGRRAVLQGFLAREVIYYTADMRERYEAQARRNLEREIARL